ncbi:hypothetical protein Tco_0592618, partial [Tanacetum coccineum]
PHCYHSTAYQNLGVLQEVTQFIGSGVEGLVRMLISSDEFHAALAHVVSLDINYGFEGGCVWDVPMLRFRSTAQKVTNFSYCAEADFNKALIAFPNTILRFPFLAS